MSYQNVVLSYDINKFLSYHTHTRESDNKFFIINVDHVLLNHIIKLLYEKGSLDNYLNSLNTHFNIPKQNKLKNNNFKHLLKLKKDDKCKFLEWFFMNDPYVLKEFYEPFNCPITLEDVNKGYITPCNHKFSKEGLNIWLETHNNCPLCRAVIKL